MLTNYMKPLLLALFAFSIISCSKQESKPILKAVNYDELKPVFTSNNDTLYVINFWATWCKPCMEELPHFLEVDQNYRNSSKYKMILVSLDKRDNIDVGVKKTIATLGIKPDVYVLDDVKNMNYWINDVNPEWSGSLPATVAYKNGKQVSYHEGKLSKEELEQLINKYL